MAGNSPSGNNSPGTAAPATGSVDAGTAADSGASALTSWTFASGLSGDADGDYEVEGTVIAPAGIGGVYSLTFNSNSAPAGVTELGPQMSNAGTTAPGGPTTGLGIGRDPVGVGGGTLEFRGRLSSKSGRNRRWTCASIYVDAGGTFYAWTFVAQIPASTSTVISDLRLQCSVASGLGAHCSVRWRKLGFTA